ncbi:BrnA antitoxin family protein [Simplicispira psychrophila]|uniref:BrnA antitoxin family protein n=1 Tax=Simplicispira psychrophila TaxID=80882 RepID=UPI000A055C73|nr:BrnA antitoxin family protein [Simplicispira psychrophila]
MKKHAHNMALIAPTPEEDARINAAIAADPDTRELTEADMAHLKPLRRLGRPPSAQPKVPVTMRVDADVLAAIKASGSGWQTRVNQVLLEAVRRGDWQADG